MRERGSQRGLRTIGAVGGMFILLPYGCTTKLLQSGGGTDRAPQAAEETSSQDGVTQKSGQGQMGPQAGGINPDFPALNGSAGPTGMEAMQSTDTGEQRVIREAMADPSVLGKDHQAADERRGAEEAATAAAGFLDVFFAYDSFDLPEAGQQTLVHDALWMVAHPDAKIRIEGQCDERGTQAYNHVLGERRAQVIQRYLVNLGVHTAQLTVVSLGKDRPWCSEPTEPCHQQNRRGHLVVRVDE